MIELRWLTKEIDTQIPGNPYVEAQRTRVLQYRYRSGNVLKNEKVTWSEWIDVPTVDDVKFDLGPTMTCDINELIPGFKKSL